MGIIGNHKQRKYGNKKYEVDGVTFDSKLEMWFYNYLKMLKIDFDFQVKVTLQDKFRFNGEAIREIYMKVDFLIKANGKRYWVDTKGFPTPDAIMKYKMLKYQEKDAEDVEVLWIKNQKEGKEFLIKITNNEFSKQSDTNRTTW